MTLSWGLLLPVGVIIARYGKRLEHTWFLIHRAIQLIGLTMAIIGYFIGLLKIGTGTHLAHFTVGTVVMILGVFNPINALFRPHPKHDKPKEQKRILWEYLHHWVGRVAIILAIAQIFLGFDILSLAVPRPDPVYRGLYIALLLILGIVVISLEIKWYCTPHYFDAVHTHHPHAHAHGGHGHHEKKHGSINVSTNPNPNANNAPASTPTNNIN